MLIDIAVSDNCKNPDSYGEICVQCNMCRRFCESCKWKKASDLMTGGTMCEICTRNPDVQDQYVKGE